MWRFVASGRPARSLGEEIGVIGIADKDSAGDLLFLEMALQTKGMVSLVEHSLIHGAVR